MQINKALLALALGFAMAALKNQQPEEEEESDNPGDETEGVNASQDHES